MDVTLSCDGQQIKAHKVFVLLMSLSQYVLFMILSFILYRSCLYPFYVLFMSMSLSCSCPCLCLALVLFMSLFFLNIFLYISLPISLKIPPPLAFNFTGKYLICCVQVILSACSLTFKNLLKQNPSQNPVILLWVSSFFKDSQAFFQCLGSISYWFGSALK